MALSKQNKVAKIDLSASMNNLSNPEVLAVSEKMYCHYLQNADLWFEKSLAVRRGTEDLCGGIVNQNFTGVRLVNVASGNLSSGSIVDWTDLPSVRTNIFDYPATIYIPSGTIALTSGTMTVREFSLTANYPTLLGAQQGYDIDIFGYLFPLDQSVIAPTVMSGTRSAPNDIPHDIALSGTFNAPPFPQYLNQNQVPPSGAIPLAIANARINMGAITSVSPFETAEQRIDYSFSAPVYINSGTAYGIRWVHALTSGTTQRSIQMKIASDASVDQSPNTRLVSEFFYIGAPANQTYALRPTVGPEKTWMLGDMFGYVQPAFLSPDFYTADTDLALPIVSGTTASGVASLGTTDFFNVRTADFGNIVPLSGNTTYFGSYFYSNFNSSFRYSSSNDKLNIFSVTNGVIMPVTGAKNVGVKGDLYRIDSSTGSIAAGDYSITQKTRLAGTSGNYVFNTNNADFWRQGTQNGANAYIQNPDFNLEKIYLVYDTPITTPSGNADYLMTFGFYDFNTGGPYTDFAVPRTFGSGFFGAQSPMVVGTQGDNTPGYSGTFVTDYSGNGIFTQPSGIYANSVPAYNPLVFNLTCGMLTVQSGNAINGIFDYRIGADRSSKIVYGQGTDLRYFDLANPSKANHTTLFTSGNATANALWSFETYDDLMFGQQYSQISGVVWNQVYSGTQLHGLQPGTTVIGATSVSGTMPSGNYGVMVTAEMSSGGFRTQNFFPDTIDDHSIAVSGSGNSIRISGLSNYYKFDVPPRPYRIFVTENSGAAFYLADVRLPSGIQALQPISGVGTDIVNIVRPANATTDISLEQATTYPFEYFATQIPVPKLKKLKAFYNHLMGIGDPDFSTRLYFSNTEEPQVFGESTNFAGYIEIEKDNGLTGPISGMELLRDYLIILKKNATYRVSFQGNVTFPFAVEQIDSKYGSLGIFGSINISNKVYFLSQYGICMTDGASVKVISDAIQPYYESLNHDNLTFAVAIHDVQRGLIVWSVNNDSFNEESNIGIAYNYKENSFYIRQAGMWNAANTVQDADGFDVILGGTAAGEIKILEKGDTDNDVVFDDGNGISATKFIDFVAETPWLTFGDSQMKKQLRFVDLNVSNSPSTLAVEVYFDNSDTLRYTRYIPLSGDSPDKRVVLGGQAKTFKLKFYNVGLPGFFKIDNINLYYNHIGIADPL